ncbi:MAG: M3 family metallopeptidase [Hyphomicrobiaceae bacterium]
MFDGLQIDISEQLTTLDRENPFAQVWETPFGIAPFERVLVEHFGPAFEAGLAQHRLNIDAIKAQTAPASLANTVDALEMAGRGLNRVAKIFFNLTGAHTNDDLQQIERDMAPKLAAHSSAIFLDQTLFARIKSLRDQVELLGLNDEQARILDRYYVWFQRAGAELDDKARTRVSEIQQKLATLSTAFNQNVLADEQAWHLVLEGEEDLAGLSNNLRDAAAKAADDMGLHGKHVVTLARSSVEGFLAYSARRDLREQAFEAWAARGAKAGATDNRVVLSEIVALRAEIAKLMGFESYAEFALQDTMAKTPEAVVDLLHKVWQPAVAQAAEERDGLAALASSEGENAEIAPWDWRYYSEKQRRAKYALDDAELSPYLSLENVINAAFETAARLFDLTFTPIESAPAYHEDCRAFEVRDGKGRHIAVFIGDYFARPSKRSGAWMSSFRGQRKLGGEVRPVVVNVMNFAAVAPGEEALISFDDAETLFHEFGHGLHGMLSDVTYGSLSGTNVTRDFVELPSQLFEHWMRHPKALERYARHHKTGAPMPKDLLERLQAARNFNQGFSTVEYTASALVDMALHNQPADAKIDDIEAFERETLSAIDMPKEIIMRHRLPHFMHITGGYAAGYYSYLWSEVMDADAFGAFEEAGDIYDRETADRLKKTIYAAGNLRDPQEAYRNFRGRGPEIDSLMKKRGFVAS